MCKLNLNVNIIKILCPPIDRINTFNKSITSTTLSKKYEIKTITNHSSISIRSYKYPLIVPIQDRTSHTVNTPHPNILFLLK